MSKWISSRLFYRPCKVYKDTFFGKSIKDGYILDSQLIFSYEDDIIFTLPVGYVWDGPSYPNWLENIVGERNAEAMLAASAMHDSMDEMPYSHNLCDRLHIKHFKIKKGAKLYRDMIKLWPNSREKPTKLQRKIQYVGLTMLQRVYTLFSSKSGWKKYK
jgi:hypothetical protein